jgi:nitronate monooxygenase
LKFRVTSPEVPGSSPAGGHQNLHKVGSVRHAKKIEELGYHGVFAAGIEEGGHPLNDDVSTMVLLPRIVDSVQIGGSGNRGIADGRGLAAALALEPKGL